MWIRDDALPPLKINQSSTPDAENECLRTPLTHTTIASNPPPPPPPPSTAEAAAGRLAPLRVSYPPGHRSRCSFYKAMKQQQHAALVLLGLTALASHAAVGCAFILPRGHAPLGPCSTTNQYEACAQHAVLVTQLSSTPPPKHAHKRNWAAPAAPRPRPPAPPSGEAARASASVPITGLDHAAHGQRDGAGGQ